MDDNKYGYPYGGSPFAPRGSGGYPQPFGQPRAPRIRRSPDRIRRRARRSRRRKRCWTERRFSPARALSP